MFENMASLTGGGGLNGGSAGPSGASGYTTTTNNMGFTGGAINFGSNNGMPSWLILLLAVGAAYVYTKTR